MRSDKLDRGFVQMAEMVNSSRLSNGVKSNRAGCGAHITTPMTVARNRVAVRKPHHRPAAGAAASDEHHAPHRSRRCR